MPIVIAKAFRKKIAEASDLEVEDVEDRLWTKCGGLCHLCDGELNQVSDQIQVDHDQPASEGGSAELENLHLAHASCNKFKAEHKSIDVRPFLKFKRFHQEHEGSLDFAEAQSYFKAKPKAIVIERKEKVATFHLPDGTKPSAPLLSEEVAGEDTAFCFVELPLGALWNDVEVQPRKIKINHLFLIAADLRINPLHEQPTCRLIAAGSGKYKLALFDGQHKALAKALNGSLSTVYKVYMDLSREQATTLVNSIQAKIKKLPLTPFELVAKMSDELKDRFSVYESEAEGEVSEAGFVEWTNVPERARAKNEIASAVIDTFLKSGDLHMTELIEGHADYSDALPPIKEGAVQNKFLKQLLHCAPLPKNFVGEGLREARQRELTNLTRILNLLFDKAFAPAKEGGGSQLQKDAAKRMTYQASLEYIAELLRKIIVNKVVPSSDALAFVEKPISEKQWTQIGKDISRLCAHPIWTAKLETSAKHRAIKDALDKNTGARQAFADVGLTPGYCVGVGI